MPPSTRTRLLAALAGPVVLTAGLLMATPAAADPPPLEFSDTFSGDSLDLSKWQYTLGTAYEGGPAAFGTGEIQTYTDSPDNVSVHDGSLYITPIRDSAGAWTSARVESVRTDFKPAEGSVMTFAFTAAMPDVPEDQAQGLWPAGWMNSARYRDDRWSWPAGGEFDVMESVSGGQWSNSVLHCGYPAQWGGPCNEPSGINAGSVPLPGAWGSFNDYSFQWDRSRGAGNDQMRWYHNDTLTQTVNQNPAEDGPDIPSDVWSNLSDPRGYHILFNEAIDGAYPAAKNALSNANTKSGVPLRIDEASISYSAGGSVPPPVTEPPVVTPPTETPAPTTPPVTEPTTPAPTEPTAPPVTEPPATTDTPAPPVTDPAPQTGLRATAVTTGSITLTWDAVPAATGYEILRAGIVIPELSPTTETTATNTGLNPSTPYIYSVRPVGGTATPEITVTTPAA